MKEKIIELYHNKKLSLRETAKILNITHYGLRYKMKKLNIKARSRSDAQKLVYSKNKRVLNKENNPNWKGGTCYNQNKRWLFYNLTEKKYNELLLKQDGKCDCCKKEFKKTPSIDHCHKTGKVRGLLCSNCNTGLGLLGDDLKSIERSLIYLKKYYNG